MKKYFNLFFILFLFSCSFYTPIAINTPLFVEKDQVAINAAITPGVSFQGAYSFSNHFFASANYTQYQIGSIYKKLASPNGKGNSSEFGIGYYKLFKEGTHFELFSGFGPGIIKSKIFERNPKTQEYDQKQFDIKYINYFIQPTFGWAKKNFEFALSTRYSLTNFKKPVTKFTDKFYNESEFKKYENGLFPLIEPSITLRAGPKNIKFQLQMLLSFSIKNNINPDISNVDAIISLGLFSKFPTKKKKTALK